LDLIASIVTTPDELSAHQKCFRWCINQVLSTTLKKMMTPGEQDKAGNPGSPFEFFARKYAEGLGLQSTSQMNPARAIAMLGKFKVADADPQVRASLIASRNLSDAMRQQTLGNMPTQEQADSVANDIIHIGRSATAGC
jgi:hypothetical protein